MVVFKIPQAWQPFCNIANADTRQDANLSGEIIFRWQMGASVPLRDKSPIINTLSAFFCGTGSDAGSR